MIYIWDKENYESHIEYIKDRQLVEMWQKNGYKVLALTNKKEGKIFLLNADEQNIEEVLNHELLHLAVVDEGDKAFFGIDSIGL